MNDAGGGWNGREPTATATGACSTLEGAEGTHARGGDTKAAGAGPAANGPGREATAGPGVRRPVGTRTAAVGRTNRLRAAAGSGKEATGVGMKARASLLGGGAEDPGEAGGRGASPPAETPPDAAPGSGAELPALSPS